MSKNTDNRKAVTKRVSVHVVFYSCPDCGYEKEHIEFCEKCGKEMRVIDVVEKFGTEAQELIEKLKATVVDNQGIVKTEEEPNIIIISEEEENIKKGVDDDADTITDEEVTELDDIFKDTKAETTTSDNISDISGILDKDEDEENTFEELGLDPDDLPTL